MYRRVSLEVLFMTTVRSSNLLRMNNDVYQREESRTCIKGIHEYAHPYADGCTIMQHADRLQNNDFHTLFPC